MISIRKLIILMMLDISEGPLTSDQLSDFVIGRECDDYFAFQELINSLTETGLIRAQSTYNRTHYLLTREGSNALTYYGSRIDLQTKKEIEDYLKHHSIEVKQMQSVFADYIRSSSTSYAVHLKLLGTNEPLIDMTLSVSSGEMAQKICRTWKENFDDIYPLILDELMGKEN